MPGKSPGTPGQAVGEEYLPTGKPDSGFISPQEIWQHAVLIALNSICREIGRTNDILEQIERRTPAD